MTEKQHPLVLFAASNDQRTYFSQLATKLPNYVSSVRWYKALPWWSQTSIEHIDEIIAEPVAMLIRRKQGTLHNLNATAWYWKIYAFWLKQQASWLARQYAHWLAREPAHWIGVWNGKKYRQAILVNVAKAMAKSVLFFEIGPLPSYSMIDPQGVNAHSNLPKDAEFYHNYHCQHHLVSPIKPKSTKIQQVFIPFQVVEDSNIYMHSPWIANMYAFFTQIKMLAQTYPQVKFLFKTHPACSVNYDDLLTQCLPNMSFIQDQTVAEVMQQVDAVISINSTVGIETIINHKPLIVLGDSLYDFFPLCLKAQNTEALNNAFDQVMSGWLPDTNIANAFIHYLQHDYAVVGNAMKSPDEQHFQAVARKLEQLL